MTSISKLLKSQMGIPFPLYSCTLLSTKENQGLSKFVAQALCWISPHDSRVCMMSHIIIRHLEPLLKMSNKGVEEILEKLLQAGKTFAKSKGAIRIFINDEDMLPLSPPLDKGVENLIPFLPKQLAPSWRNYSYQSLEYENPKDFVLTKSVDVY